MRYIYRVRRVLGKFLNNCSLLTYLVITSSLSDIKYLTNSSVGYKLIFQVNKRLFVQNLITLFDIIFAIFCHSLKALAHRIS